MRISFLSAALTVCSIITASTIPTTTSDNQVVGRAFTDIARFMAFPQIAIARIQPDRRRRKGAGMTNAERLRRGLPIAKPQNLYKARTLAERQVPAPQVAQASQGSTTGRLYEFVGCANLGEGASPAPTVAAGDRSDLFSLTNSPLQELANQCAGKQDIRSAQTTNPIPDTGYFGIYPNDPGTNCGTAIVYTGVLVPCRTDTVGVYTLQ